jgi:transposase
MENKVTLTMKEQHKVKMVIDYEAGKIRARRAAELLGISKRQFRRLVAGYRQRGIAALAHGNRGRSPGNRISEEVRQEILRLAKETYQDSTTAISPKNWLNRPSRSWYRARRCGASGGQPGKAAPGSGELPNIAVAGNVIRRRG